MPKGQNLRGRPVNWITTRPCPICEKSFTAPLDVRTCSRACGAVVRWAGRRKWAPDQRTDLRQFKCPVCDFKGLKPMGAVTCSVTCGRKHRMQKPPVKITCKPCGAEFEQASYNPANVERCPDCRKRQSLHWLTCPVCAITVLRERRFAACSRSCGNVLQWSARKKWSNPKERQLAKAATRRVRMVGSNGRIEAIDPAMIAERDAWLCGICRGAVDSSLRYPNRQSASIDHIVPLSLGGEHTANNVQLAHFGCNVARGIRPLAEDPRSVLKVV